MKVIMSKVDATVYLIGPKMMYRWPFAERQDALQGLGVLFFLALIIALTASWVLFRTRVGLSLRAVGENPGTADALYAGMLLLLIRSGSCVQSETLFSQLRIVPVDKAGADHFPQHIV